MMSRYIMIIIMLLGFAVPNSFGFTIVQYIVYSNYVLETFGIVCPSPELVCEECLENEICNISVSDDPLVVQSGICVLNATCIAIGVLDPDNDGLVTGDNCPNDYNPDQSDFDNDGIGDVCDIDDDNDAIFDLADFCPFDLDNDADGDNVCADVDNCPDDFNFSQEDFDGDGFGDVCDEDIDGDGVINANDLCMLTSLDTVVSPNSGCSIAQSCPCNRPMGTTTPWKNHGKYVSCVSKTSRSFLDLDLISEVERDVIISSSAQSSCGKK